MGSLLLLIFHLRLFPPRLRRFCLPLLHRVRGCSIRQSSKSRKTGTKERGCGPGGGAAGRVSRFLPCSHKFRRSSRLFAQFLAFFAASFCASGGLWLLRAAGSTPPPARTRVRVCASAERNPNGFQLDENVFCCFVMTIKADFASACW